MCQDRKHSLIVPLKCENIYSQYKHVRKTSGPQSVCHREGTIRTGGVPKLPPSPSSFYTAQNTLRLCAFLLR